MSGSYILLAALGIFILIGGGKRILKSFNLSSIGAVGAIVLIIVGNLFQPIGRGASIYIGTLILVILSIIHLISYNFKSILGSLIAITLVSTALIIYDIYVIERFSVEVVPSLIMIIAGCGIFSFILTKTSSQSFVVALISILIFNIATSVIRGESIVIGDSTVFDMMIYSSLIAVMLNELVSEFMSLYADSPADIRFETSMIDEKEDKSNRN